MLNSLKFFEYRPLVIVATVLMGLSIVLVTPALINGTAPPTWLEVEWCWLCAMMALIGSVLGIPAIIRHPRSFTVLSIR